MGHDASFCGDRLRLAAFLRVVENLPQRPCRFRRRLKHELGQQASNLIETNDNRPIDSATTAPNYGGQAANRITCGQKPKLLTLPRRPKKELIAYRAQADVASQELLSARRKQPLLVNGLALIRSTTEDGLPVQSNADAVFVSSIPDTDPIQDSQPVIPQALVLHRPNKSTPGSSVYSRNSASNSQRARVSLGRATRGSASLSPPMSKLGVDQTAFINLPARSDERKHHLQPGFATCRDGFVGTESTPVIKDQKRRVLPPKQKRHESVKGALVLAEGFLPLPLIPHPGPDSTSTVRGPVQRPLAPLDMEIDTPGVKPMVCLPAKALQDKAVVFHQLTSITATTRHRSKSSFNREIEQETDHGQKNANVANHVDNFGDFLKDYPQEGFSRHDQFVRTPKDNDRIGYLANSTHGPHEERADTFVWVDAPSPYN